MKTPRAKRAGRLRGDSASAWGCCSLAVMERLPGVGRDLQRLHTHLCANLETRNAGLEMPRNGADVAERENGARKKFQRMALQIRLDTLEK